MKHLKNLYQNMTVSKKITAYLLAATLILSLGYIAGYNTAYSGNPRENGKARNVKLMIAKEQDCATVIKMLPSIADVKVIAQKSSQWERNAWVRKPFVSVSLFVEPVGYRPIPRDTITAVSRIAALFFGIDDMQNIKIVDTKHDRAYDGNGEETAKAKVKCRCECCPCPEPAENHPVPPYSNS